MLTILSIVLVLILFIDRVISFKRDKEVRECFNEVKNIINKQSLVIGELFIIDKNNEIIAHYSLLLNNIDHKNEEN